jgi:hypothetical protein
MVPTKDSACGRLNYRRMTTIYDESKIDSLNEQCNSYELDRQRQPPHTHSTGSPIFGNRAVSALLVPFCWCTSSMQLAHPPPPSLSSVSSALCTVYIAKHGVSESSYHEEPKFLPPGANDLPALERLSRQRYCLNDACPQRWSCEKASNFKRQIRHVLMGILLRRAR